MYRACYCVDKREDLYANHWRKNGETLGADSCGEVFDEFPYNWLTAINAPTSIVVRDVCRLIKRHFIDNGCEKLEQMVYLLKEAHRHNSCCECFTESSTFP